MSELPDRQQLSALLQLSGELARAGVSSVALLCDPENRRFWRNTLSKGAAPQHAETIEPFPTVSLACSTALLQALQFVELPDTSEVRNALAVAKAVPAAYELKDLESSSLAEGPRLSPFTVAQYLQCLAELAVTENEIAQQRFDKMLPEIANHESSPLTIDVGLGKTHPFIIYHLLRAARACDRRFGGSEFLRSIMESGPAALTKAARDIIASHALGAASPNEYVALAFCGCGLASTGSPLDQATAISALSIAASEQDGSGCWALGRIVEDNKDAGRPDRIEISTYEIAWAIATAARRLLQAEAPGISVELGGILGAVAAAARHAQRSAVAVEFEGRRIDGWCSDHPYGQPLVESWTSATVLHSGIEFQRLVSAWESMSTLEQFIHARPTDESWPRWLRWRTYMEDGEVDHSAPVLGYLNEHIVEPINSSAARLPSSSAGTVSALLFGPPGTSKTTIVKAMADGLGWPVVQLNPGVFIERGLELIEAQARGVFEDLHRLRRCVVLFDECDELFRERQPAQSTEQVRSITAFVTASMLPKLQDLHDLGHVVFVICTNNFDSLDSAVKRRGRIDHILGVGPPDELARRKIVEGVLDRSIAREAPGVSRLYEDTDRFTRGELTHLTRQFNQQHQGSPSGDALTRKLILEMAPSLNISEKVLAAFREQAATSSANHPNGRA